MLCADRAQSELRQSSAISWRHIGQRYTYQDHRLEATSKLKRMPCPQP